MKNFRDEIVTLRDKWTTLLLRKEVFRHARSLRVISLKC
jgi:hypothetical protein